MSFVFFFGRSLIPVSVLYFPSHFMFRFLSFEKKKKKMKFTLQFTFISNKFSTGSELCQSAFCVCTKMPIFLLSFLYFSFVSFGSLKCSPSFRIIETKSTHRTWNRRPLTVVACISVVVGPTKWFFRYFYRCARRHDLMCKSLTKTNMNFRSLLPFLPVRSVSTVIFFFFTSYWLQFSEFSFYGFWFPFQSYSKMKWMCIIICGEFWDDCKSHFHVEIVHECVCHLMRTNDRYIRSHIYVYFRLLHYLFFF